MQKNIDRIIFYEDLRKAIVPVFIALVFAAVWIIFDLNSPVEQEVLQGKAIRSMMMTGGKTEPSILTYVELENGRTITVQLPIGAIPPVAGARVSVTRYIKRFFGDSFGLN